MRGFATLSGAALASLALAACGTAPLSFLDGQPLDRVTLNRYGVRIVSVDGQINFRNPVQVAPGPHVLVVEARRGDGPDTRMQRTFALNVEPCTHYYLAADRESPLTSPFELVVQAKEKVAGCNPEEEVKKAKPPA
jgi:hypothetical protein